MKVLDLFCGLGGWSAAFVDRGHEVVTVDSEPKFNPTICDDIRRLNPPDFTIPYGGFDVILASPPCECFSVASIGYHWKDHKPDVKTLEAIGLVKHTLGLIYALLPKFWFLENPRGKLRTVIGNPPVTVYYPQYGENRLKPTDIWGRHPKGFKEMQITDTTLLDYEKAPRGSKTGTQGIQRTEERAKIPYPLSLTVCKLCEGGL